MAPRGFELWLTTTPLWVIGLILIICLIIAAFVGTWLQKVVPSDGSDRTETQQGYLVSGVLGLLALLLGFTFALAVDRFDTRRERVLESANAIGTAYLQTQLLGEPHRTRISNILVSYTDNIIVLAKAKPGPAQREMVAKDDAIMTELWAATAAGFDSIRGIDFSSTYVSSLNNMLDLDAARRAARQAHVPAEVFEVLLIYLVVSGGVLGYVLVGLRGRLTASFLVILTALALLLIIDIDRPTMGRVTESQAPIEAVRKSMTAQPPAVFDRWRDPSRDVAKPSSGTP